MPPYAIGLVRLDPFVVDRFGDVGEVWVASHR